MCGILAQFAYDGTRPVDLDTLRAMADTMEHRGPDDADYRVRGPVGLAHRRLSIIDLSAAGRQPMPNEDESVWLTFNGEIYNFPELRRELIGRGHRFRSNADSEVILHGYEEWGGPGCVERLRGMFGFVIWDEAQRTLFCARDRLGIKPVYYRDDGHTLIVASELKAILRHPDVEARVDASGLLQHFGFRFTLPPKTAFEGISKLAAGQHLTCRDGRSVIETYWSPPDRDPENRASHSFDEWAGILEEKLLETVEGHLLSDVPVGAFLSGGVDSGSLVAMASGFADQPVQTYTAGFGSGWHDESEQALEVATLHATNHHATTIEPTPPERLSKILWHLEEPLINTSTIPLYAVSELAARDVKVVLAGDGSDEVNGGYLKFARIESLLRLRGLRHAIPGADGALDLLARALPDRGPAQRWKRWNRITSATRGEFAALSSTALSGGGDAAASFFSSDVAHRFDGMTEQVEDALLSTYRNVSDPRQRFFLYDMRGWLANELLIRADKITMAHSLEARVPYLDHELAELCLSMPADFKLHEGRTKAILRHAMQRRLPRETTRRRQHGFVVPLHEWIRGEWRELVCDLASDSRTRSRGLFDHAAVDHMIEEHLAGRADWTAAIFGFTMTELWHREFIDGPAAR